MGKRARGILAALAFVAGTVGLSGCDTHGPKKVLAFYYPWYGTPSGPSGKWFHWNPAQPHYDSTHVPSLGTYDSKSPEIIDQQLAWAKQAGLDGFIASWWGIGTFEDEALGVLVKQAEASDFKVSVYLEDASSVADLKNQLQYLLKTYGPSPAFLRHQEKPVLFVYSRIMTKFMEFQFAAIFQGLKEEGYPAFYIGDSVPYVNAFDGLHFYNLVSQPLWQIAVAYKGFRELTRGTHDLWAATVVPGYDDTKIRTPGLAVDRADGKYYDKSWEAALASSPDWILVTSFNEWHEGSEIEPSVEFGESYLERTAEKAKVWNAAGK